MKKKLILTMLTLTVAVALLAGGTMAWFTDTDDAGTATFTAGVLDVDVSKGLGNITTEEEQEFYIGPINHMNPGDIYEPITINIENKGTKKLAWFGNWTFDTIDGAGDSRLLDAMYIDYMKMEFLAPDDDPNDDKEPTWQDADVFIENGRGAGNWPDWYNKLADMSGFKVITLRNWNNNAGMVPGTVYEHMGALKPGYKYRLTVKFGFCKDAGNYYQGVEGVVSPIEVGFNVFATQVNFDALEAAGGALLSNHFNYLNDEINKQN